MYLIYDNIEDAQARNHEEACRRMWSSWQPKTDRDTPYWWASVTHPTTGQVALKVGSAESVKEEEVGLLVETLDSTWTAEVQDA